MAQLKDLQADGVIKRHDYKEVPPKVEYSLTTFGTTLARALAPLCVWGTENMSKVQRIMLKRQASEDLNVA